MSDSQKELVEKNRVDALVQRRNSDKVYIWPTLSSQLAGDKSGNPAGQKYSDMKEYLNMIFDSISHYLIHISYREEPTESSKDKAVLIAFGAREVLLVLGCIHHGLLPRSIAMESSMHVTGK